MAEQSKQKAVVINSKPKDFFVRQLLVSELRAWRSFHGSKCLQFLYHTSRHKSTTVPQHSFSPQHLPFSHIQNGLLQRCRHILQNNLQLLSGPRVHRRAEPLAHKAAEFLQSHASASETKPDEQGWECGIVAAPAITI